MASEIKITNKVISIAGRKLTVCKKTFEMQLRRFTLMEEAERRLNGDGNPQEGEGIEAIVRRTFTRITYPSLAACTKGKVLTEQECYLIESDDLDLWLSTARELNPDWFPVSTVSAETAAEALEKKE